MIGAIGLAMGALSSMSSLAGQAADSISQASNQTLAQSVTAAPLAKVKAMVPRAAINSGVPIPKFEKQMHAHLLALQEKLRS